MDDTDEHVLQTDSDLQSHSSTLQDNLCYVPHLAENTFYQQHMVQARDYDSCYVPRWVGYQQIDPFYVEYLAANGIANIEGPISYDSNAIFNIQGPISYDSTGIGCSSVNEESFLSMDGHLAEPRGVNPYDGLNMVRHEDVPVNNFETTRDGIFYQKQGTSDGLDSAVQYQPNSSVSTSSIGTKSRKKNLRQKAYEVDCRRRKRISAALDALEGVIPHSREGNKLDVVDGCIDYIKSLQLRMKELSQNRLRCEPTSHHLRYLEGHGHYLVHENTVTGPLEDTVGKVLETNTFESTKMLESKGLFIMPFVSN